MQVLPLDTSLDASFDFLTWGLLFVIEINYEFPLLECCLAGGGDFENSRFFIFVCVALRAASILRNHILLYLINVLQVPKHLYLVGFEHRECSRTFSFEK